MAGHDHPHHPTPLERVFSLLAPERREVWVVVLFAVGVGLFTLATPLVAGAVLNNAALGTLAQQVFVLVLGLLIALVLAAVLQLLQTVTVEYIQRRLFVRVVDDRAYRLPRVKEDSESVRNGTANRFVIVEPLAGRRQVTVTERRTIPDFAAQMKYLCDELCPHAAVIRVVPDNPNPHAVGSLFASFPPAEAWRRPRRLEFHDTPEHASWPNVAERESSVPAGQCLGRRIPTREQLATEVAAWATHRNAEKAKIEWTFRVADARVKLDFLDPMEFPR